ncbi:aquaporin-like protein [Scleroderma yunnanense]
MSQAPDKSAQPTYEASSAYSPVNETILRADQTEGPQLPNRWAEIRESLREPFAEFLGTMILIIFGCGGNCQVVLSSKTAVASSPKGDFLSLNFGWALGLGIGVWVSGGISGGHLNPAVTLAFASLRDFPWKKVPIYFIAQLLGAICGAGIVYANYYHAINVYEGGSGIRTISGTGDLFATYAADYMTSVSSFFSEFLGAAMLIIGILAATDKGNKVAPSPGLIPLVICFTFLGIGITLGMETGYAINPARDLGPRILTAMVGYGKEVFNFRNQYWLWCPFIGSILGMQFGALAYDLLIYTGSDSVINKS